ncbi:MAG: hypothetical protein ABUT20_31905 [Bacteroidota bacterium]
MKTIFTIILLSTFIFSINSCNKESSNAAGNPQSGAGGSTARFTIAGNYLYVVDHTSVKSFDISNQSNPVLKSKTEIGINIETIFPYQDKLFIGSSSSMYIYSLADPAKPVRTGKADYTIRMSCDPVIAKDSVAYATLRATGRCGGSMSALVVYNIKNLSAPALVNTVPLNAPYGLGIKDSALYVCEGQGGLRIYNVRNAYNPEFISEISGHTFYDVIPYDNILIGQVNDGFVLYDIGVNRLKPVFLSKVLN